MEEPSVEQDSARRRAAIARAKKGTFKPTGPFRLPSINRPRKGLVDMVGVRIGKVVILTRHGNNMRGAATWDYLCDCGASGVVAGTDLRREVIGGRRRIPFACEACRAVDIAKAKEAKRAKISSNPKQCRGCGKYKPASAFYPKKQAKDGLQSRCRDCDNDCSAKRGHIEGVTRPKIKVCRVCWNLPHRIDGETCVGCGRRAEAG